MVATLVLMRAPQVLPTQNSKGILHRYPSMENPVSIGFPPSALPMATNPLFPG